MEHSETKPEGQTAVVALPTALQLSDVLSEEDLSVDGRFALEHREELVRMSVQLLRGLGYKKAAGTLEEEAGVALESTRSSQLKSSVLSGNWDTARQLISSTADWHSIKKPLLFACAKQQYLEVLENDKKAALDVLRIEVTPTAPSPKEIHALSVLLVAGAGVRGWDGVKGGRVRIVRSLSTLLADGEVLQEDRLAQLLQQSQRLQRESCAHLNDPGGAHTLLRDYSSAAGALPTQATYTLCPHREEVWQVVFSHSGHLIASGDKVGVIHVHSVQSLCEVSLPEEVKENPKVHLKQTLRGHGDAITVLAFSQDDTLLLSASMDFTVKVWNVSEGITERLVCTFQGHAEMVTAVAWCPSGRHFVSAGTDRKMFIVSIDDTTTVLREWFTSRVLDMKLTPSGDLITIDSEKRVICYDLNVPYYGVLTVAAYPPLPGTAIATSGKAGGTAFLKTEKEATTATTLSITKKVFSQVVCSILPPAQGTASEVNGNGCTSPWVHHLTGQRRDVQETKQQPGVFSSVHYYFTPTEEAVEVPEGAVAWSGTVSGAVVPVDPIRWVLEEASHSLACCELSKCGGFLLCAVAVKEGRGRVQLYDLKARRVVQQYVGARQTKYVVRAVFGGLAESFVLTGSEDGRVLVFSRKTGQVLASLVSHVRLANWYVKGEGVGGCCHSADTLLWDFFFFFIFQFPQKPTVLPGTRSSRTSLQAALMIRR